MRDHYKGWGKGDIVDVNAVSGTNEILNRLMKESIDAERNLTQDLLEKSAIDTVEEAKRQTEAIRNDSLGHMVDYSV